MIKHVEEIFQSKTATVARQSTFMVGLKWKIVISALLKRKLLTFVSNSFLPWTSLVGS